MRIFSLLTIFGFVAVLFGCGGGGGNPVNPPPPDKTTEWTVMLYMGADNNLAPCALADLDELEHVGSTDKVHFTALADVFYATWDQFSAPAVFCLQDNEGNLVTPMMHITKHPEAGVQSHLADSGAVLHPNEGFNSADPANLTSFIKWSKQRFPAKRYALIIWDHGSSWLPGRMPSAAVSDNSEAGGNAMFIHEIESAIKNSGVRFNLLDFTACNMASVEVCYQLRDVADYICASQRTMWVGVDGVYETLAGFLTSNPTSSAEILGKTLVDAYISAYAEKDLSSVTQSLIRTDKVAAIAAAVSQLTPLLSDPKIISSGNLLSMFKEPIRFMQDVDICNFSNVVPYHVSNTSLNTALANIRQKVKDAVVYNRVFVTQTPPKEDWDSWGTREFSQGQDIKVNGVGGLSIFLPTDMDWTQHNFGYYTSTAFAKASGWNWVIAHAYQGITPLETAPGGWLAALVWSTSIDLDFYVFEPILAPDGQVVDFYLASPWLGNESYYGLLSPDSSWTGISAEVYQAKPEIPLGPYFFLAVFYNSSQFANAAWCTLGIFDNPSAEEPAIVSNDYYISATQPVDPDFGAGVVFFGFAFYDPPTKTWWFYENDRTGESVTQDQIGSIAGQLRQLGPQTADSKLRRPQGVDQATIDQWSKQGAELAERLRQSSGNPGGLDTESGWARAH
jgi:hypothetical protein